MRYALVASLLMATSLWAAQQPASQPGQAPSGQQAKPVGDDDLTGLPASAAKVAPEAAVITVKGLCPKSSSGRSADVKQSCVTEVSRQDFENLAEAILSSHAQAKIRQLAKSYPDLVALAQAAESRGLEKNQRVEERIAFARLQILSQELLREIDEESSKIQPSEIEGYYKAHPERYETATLDRIYVPLRKNQQPNSETEMKQLAEKLRTRAAVGENFLSLQKEAFTSAGMTDVPPNPSLGQVHRNDLPPAHISVFDLKAGEVSQVFTDGTGSYIYRLESKQVQPFEKAQDNIRRTLKFDRRQKAVQAIQQGITTTLNPEYFGPDDSSSDTSKSK